jgi:hypothetical protein
MATETQIVREAPEIEAYKLGLLEKAKAETEKPLTLPAYQAAGISELQQKAIDLGQQGIGVYAPFLQQGTTSIGQGQELTQAGARGAAGIDVAPQFQTAQGMFGQAATQAMGGAGAYSPDMAAAFMNPYQAAVTQQALGEMRRQADIARQGQAAQAIRAGAFGGTREGVQRAETERGLADIMGQKILQDYAQNYGQAQQAAQQSFEAQRQRQLALSGQLTGIGGAMGQQAAQQANIGLQQAETLGRLGAGMGTLGIQQAGMGQTYADLAARDVAQLGQLGTLQSQAEQARLDAIRATELQKSLSPYQRLGFLSDIYKGAPTSQMSLTSATSPTTSPLLQAVGLGISGLSAAAGASKAGLFG